MKPFEKAITIWFLILGTVMVAATCYAIVNLVGSTQPTPQVPSAVLVGTGCEGPSPIAVAAEEDLLPICKDIEVHQVATGLR